MAVPSVLSFIGPVFSVEVGPCFLVQSKSSSTLCSQLQIPFSKSHCNSGAKNDIKQYQISVGGKR